jgi:hypothetical protein
MSNDETKLYDEDDAVAEAGADGVRAGLEKALPHVTMEEDHAALRRIDFALAEHGETTAKWRGRLSPTSPATAINCAAPGAPDRPSGRPADRARSSAPAVATPRQPAIRRGFE